MNCAAESAIIAGNDREAYRFTRTSQQRHGRGNRSLSGGGRRSGALDFVEALESAFLHIRDHPTSGSLRYAYELDLPGLRVWPLKRYPFLLFYMEHEGHIDVWRILHAERDIPAWMTEQDSA